MRKGSALARWTAGMVMVAWTAACGGGDAETGSETGAASEAPGAAAPAGGTTAAPATDTSAAAAPAGGDAQLVSQGQQIFASSVCVSCHGANAAGTPLAPDLTDDEWLWVDPAGDMQAQVAEIIRTGVSQPKDPAHVTPMPPYGGGPPLDDSQVQALAAYVVSLSE